MMSEARRRCSSLAVREERKMADLEDVTLDGRPLQSLRVADLKAALEERGLSKSGQKNALVKRLKGALMLENLQKTSTAHVGLQPNSQHGAFAFHHGGLYDAPGSIVSLTVMESKDAMIGEEMSQNSFIKQYLAKQQELLRQRLEREAREAFETNDQEDHTDVKNNVCPPQVPDASTAVTDHFKPPGPSSGQAVPTGVSHRHQEAAMSIPLASVSVAHDRNEAAADSDEEESEDGDDDGDGDGDDDDDWDSNVQRRLPRQPVRAPMARERSAASCQPQQQLIPSVLSPQLRQPTPPPSPPPELSFPLPDTPKQSPPSPDVAAGGRSPSSSSSGSSSSGSRSSSPEPHSGHAERKPGPLTLLARKMESEGAFSGAEWHCRDANRPGVCSSSTFPNKVRPEGLMSSVPHMLTASHAPINLGATQGHAQVPVLKVTAERDAELERGESLELQRQAQQRKNEQERALEEERVRAALEKQKALEKEQFEREQALEKERELALAREREEKEQALALERQRALERELVLKKEQEERERRLKEEQEKAMELERARILERERALEQERLERERALEAARIERERMEREKALELERLEKERLERERLEREAALERERLERERERMEREKASEQERIERERIEQLRALEKERIEREKALAQERIERERALEQERIERERILEQERIERERALEQQRIERARELERLAREKALEQERLEQERIKREEALEKERLEQERIKRDKALEQERLEQERVKREKAREQERIEQERIEREKALELERIEREKALELERIERKKAQERERIERERALEREKIEKEKALERERIELAKALERERVEKERIDRERIEHERALKLEQREREQALEKRRLELEKQENERIDKKQALEQERIQREKAIEQKEKAEGEAALERERLEKAEQERLELEKAQEMKRQVLQEESRAKKNALELEKLRLAGEVSVEKKQPAQKENAANESRMADVKSEDQIGFVPLPTPPPLSTGTSRKTSTEAGKQQGEVHGPVTCEHQAEESNTPKSPQPVLKKFRFSRETPLQPQAVSRVIKRPRAFSDTPQPCASVMSATIADGQQQKEQSVDLEADAGQFVPDVNQVEAVESAKKKEATNVLSESKEEFDENEAAVKKRSILTDVEDQVVGPSSPVGASGRGRNVKKTEKKDLRRSLSNDSSESDSASSSSPSTDSSSSLREKTYTSRQSRDEETASPQSIEAAKVQKTRSTKLEISSANAQIDEGLLTKLNEASSRDDLQTRKGSEDDEDKPENSCDGESSVSEPEKGTEANNETPKAFSTRKISLSSSKSSPGSTENEHDLGTAGGRKRRWGSSTAVTAKKPSISITTDSLKSLIPDIKPALNQEEVMELHPEEPVLSETEEEEKDHADQELQIRRTVTQIVHVDNQEDGQKDAKRRRAESEEEDALEEKETKISEDPTCTQAIESPSPSHTSPDADIPSVAQSDILIRRSISQQKIGVSITIDDPVRTARQPSPPRGNVSTIVHVCNLVRPFTLGQLKELLSRTGMLVEDGFWIDKIKSHCYVTYSSSEEAVATRAALHGVKWPQSNPKVLSVDFCQQDELDFHKGLGSGDRAGIGMQSHGRSLPSLLPERDQWVEREREMERRERARAEREWDRDKVKEFGKAPEQKEAGARRSRSRERRRKEREKSKEKKTEKKEKPEDPPAKLLDDLFRKTKAVPCIYWLPLTEEQYLQREAARVERRKEREMQRKKEEEEAELKKKEENKERMKPGSGLTVDRSESEKIRDRDRARDRGRDREREREADKRRDGNRRPGVGAAPSGRRSRSRSDPRERRR